MIRSLSLQDLYEVYQDAIPRKETYANVLKIHHVFALAKVNIADSTALIKSFLAQIDSQDLLSTRRLFVTIGVEIERVFQAEDRLLDHINSFEFFKAKKEFRLQSKELATDTDRLQCSLTDVASHFAKTKHSKIVLHEWCSLHFKIKALERVFSLI